VTGEVEQVVPLGAGQVQALRDGGDHLLGRVRSALAFQPAVVVGGDVAEDGDLLPAQTGGPAALTARQADVLGLQRLAAAAQELGQPGSINHGASFPVRCAVPFYRGAPTVSTACRSQAVSVGSAGRG
jgi:hypothetical protein